MSKTKKRILAIAKTLFNEKGLAEVPLRQIALAAKMSQGNLNYHFPHREDIVQALYLELVAALDEMFEKMSASAPSLGLIHESSRRSMELLQEYRFLMLDFVQVMRSHPEILEHFRQLRIVRERQMEATFNFLIATGLMQPESFPGQYRSLMTRFSILGDFWISSAEIHSTLPPQERASHYSWVLLESVFPLLTEKGKSEFMEIRNREKGNAASD